MARSPRVNWLAVLSTLIGCLVVLGAPHGAGAQEGPQFGNWGPGMPPPEQEGIDQSAQAALTPGVAAAPGGAEAPSAIGAIPIAGCPYDLRGTWLNQGQQTVGGSRSYSATVSVRQFHTWIMAQQDDGASYYGQCAGNRLMFDMYNGYQYVGRQYGTIYSGSRLTPVPLPGGASPFAAPAPPPPGRTGALWASFTWTAWFGSGSETWTQTSLVTPPTPTATETPTPLPTSTPTASPTPAAPAPVLEALEPASGPAGIEVVIRGRAFAGGNNLITFGPSMGLHHPDGAPGNLVARSGSDDSTTLRFVVPSSGPSGVLCDDAGNCIGVTSTLPVPGSYEVTVINSNGASNSLRFELTPGGSESINGDE